MQENLDLEVDVVLKNMARSTRRHHRERLKQKRRFFWGHQRDLSKESAKVWAQVVDTPTPCSCAMCGNARRHFSERTVAERRFYQKDADL